MNSGQSARDATGLVVVEPIPRYVMAALRRGISPSVLERAVNNGNEMTLSQRGVVRRVTIHALVERWGITKRITYSDELAKSSTYQPGDPLGFNTEYVEVRNG